MPDGTTLRTHLSSILNCDPMRITKKFTGDSCIGKRIFQPLSRSGVNEIINNVNINNNVKNDDDSSSGNNSNIYNSNIRNNDNDNNNNNKNNKNNNIEEVYSIASVTSTSNSTSTSTSTLMTNFNSIISNEDIKNKNDNINDDRNENNHENDNNINDDDNKHPIIETTTTVGTIGTTTDRGTPPPSIKQESDIAKLISDANNKILIETSRRELKILRKIWLEKMLGAERETARKNCVRSSSAVKHSSGRNKVSVSQ